MRVWCPFILVAALCSTVEAQTPVASACDLLTAAEVEAAAGWKPGAPEAESYGTTSTCTFTGNALKREVVVLTVTRPAPKVATSAAFAERRTADGKRTPEIATGATPLEGLGAPAIRSDQGSGPATIEAVTARPHAGRQRADLRGGGGAGQEGDPTGEVVSRTRWLLAAVLAGCGTAGDQPRVSAREIFPDSLAAALAGAAADGDTALVRRLIADGADPNARGRSGITLPQWALLNRSAAGVAALLEGGADPAQADSSGETVVHYAAKANDPVYLKVLLEHRADPNTRHAVTRATPLVPALMADREENFRRLLAAGADPNAADRMGDTPLHVAAKINAFARVLDLLEVGADPRAKNQRGATFQTYLERTPADIMTDDARRQREKIQAWVREHQPTLSP